MATLQPGPIARTPLEHANFQSATHKRTRGPQTLCRTECAMPIQNACKRNTHVAWYRLASLDRHLEAAGVLSCKLESQRPPTMGGQGCVASRSHRRSPRSRARAKAARSAREFRTCDSGYPIVTRPKGLCRLRTYVDLLWVVWEGNVLQRPKGWPQLTIPTTRSRGEVSDTFEGLAHRSGARETLGQRGTCNGSGTRPAPMGKASQSTVDVLYTHRA